MKRIVIFIALVLIALSSAWPQDLIPFRQGSRWGFCDKNKKLVIPNRPIIPVIYQPEPAVPPCRLTA